MKRFIIILSCFLCISFIQSRAIAEEKLPFSATASSTYRGYTQYAPNKALDSINGTYWLGERDQMPWWITFDAGEVLHINRLYLTWYSSTYAPSDYDIQVSTDGTNWDNVFTGIQGIYYPDGEPKEINHNARYIRLYINNAYHYGVLREFVAYGDVITNMPRTVRFEGSLKDSLNMPIDGLLTLTFRLYDADTAGTPVWEEIQEDVEVTEGEFSAELGIVEPLDLSFNTQYWLGIEVESDGEMIPRFKLTSVPYAFTSSD